jgi:hypothetical protein
MNFLDGLSKLPEVSWDKRLDVGLRCRIVGQFHVQAPSGYLHASPEFIVVGTYQGQLTGDPTRHVFTADAGTRYVVSSPEHTGGITTARLYRMKKLARAAVAA